jgi:hypothetical protein
MLGAIVLHAIRLSGPVQATILLGPSLGAAVGHRHVRSALVAIDVPIPLPAQSHPAPITASSAVAATRAI